MTTDDSPSMGTMVPHEICKECEGEPPKPDPNPDFRLFSVSLVTFSDDDIRQVAEHLDVPEADVRAHLAGERRIKGGDKAFHYITGCYPFKRV